MRKKNYYLAILLAPLMTFSQDLPPVDEPPIAPIDSGVYLCLLIGFVYAGFILYKRNNERFKSQISSSALNKHND